MKKVVIGIIGLIAVGTILVFGLRPGVPTTSPTGSMGRWPLFMGSSDFSLEPTNGPQFPLALRRRMAAGSFRLIFRDGIQGLVVWDNIVVVSTWFHVRAFDLNSGHRLWSVRTPGEVANSMAALVTDGQNIFWVSNTKDTAVLHSVDLQNGKNHKSITLDKWGWRAGSIDVCRAGLNIDAGTIYISLTAKPGKNVFAVSADLKRIVWSRSMEGQFLHNMAPAILDDRLYFAYLEQGSRYMCRAVSLAKKTGEIIWTQGFIGVPYLPPALEDGYMYQVTTGFRAEGNVYRFDLESGQKVTLENRGSGPFTVANDKVIVGDFLTGQSLRAINSRSGKVIWEKTFNEGRHIPDAVTPPIISGNRVYFGSGDGFVWVLDEGTGKALWEICLIFRDYPGVANMALVGHDLIVAGEDG